MSSDDELRKLFKIYRYMEESSRLLAQFGTANNIPEEELHVFRFNPQKLKVYCVQIEKRRKAAH